MPLHGGRVPAWLYQRMERLSGAIVEVLVEEFGVQGLLGRISDPFWFQSFGAVLGMDWHSSGITTSVMGALKRSINKRSEHLGLYVCGGRGKHSLKTPEELLSVSERFGTDGQALVRTSKLSAKVDNTAIQDGFQLYLHSFLISRNGAWAVVQQGMNTQSRMARRYHWLSSEVKSFIEEPHTSVYGKNIGAFLNLTSRDAGQTRKSILEISSQSPAHMIPEIQKLIMPRHHEVRSSDIDLKRLGTLIGLAYDRGISSFESLLLLRGLGPKTIRSLALVSEIIFGTPVRFSDPARFSFAHGGKDGTPFPVQTSVYDETIDLLQKTVTRARIEHSDKKKALHKLHLIACELEKKFIPKDRLLEFMEKERAESSTFGGRTAGDSKKNTQAHKSTSAQLRIPFGD